MKLPLCLERTETVADPLGLKAKREHRSRTPNVRARWERGRTPSPRAVSMIYKCPICGKPTEKDASPEFPFCSERCRLLDLGNWASERYVVSEPVIDEDELETPKEDNEPDR